ncbi:MAG: hypothetical protein ACN4G0_01710 [Polyangiales bacterium]
MSELTIEFAGSRYHFAGLNPLQDAVVRPKFESLLCRDDRKPDIQIDIHHDPTTGAFMRRPSGPTEYRVAVAHRDASIDVAGIGFTATVDRASLRAQIHTCLSDQWFAGAFENAFRVVAAYRLFGQGALVMHSAALTDGDRGFVFCGRSGAGKSTLCGLAEELELGILSDELNAVMPSGGSFELLAMPFAGDFGAEPRPHPPYPLTGLLGLSHDTIPSVDGCSKAEAISRIVASCPYVNADPWLVDELSTRAAALVEQIPLRVLSFSRDTRFWSVLDHEYRSLAESVSH